jgi:hypothetical protein
MPSEINTWIGGGIAAVFLYIIISNTFWLLFGSRILQSLPNVNIGGFRGTIKIATMLILSLFGFFIWILKYAFMLLARKSYRPVLSEEVRKTIQLGATVITRKAKKN